MSSGISLPRLIGREMQRSKFNTLLCLVTVVVATAILIAMLAISRASVDQTRVMMKKMGFNVLITPQGVDPARYQALDFQDADMPEEYVHKLAGSRAVAQHFVGKLQETIQVDGRTVVLTGVLAEVVKHGTKKTPMPTAYEVPEGQVYAGSAAATALGVKEGDPVTVLGKAYEVGKILPEQGIIPDDIRLYVQLHDVQALLDRPGRINAIDALSCFCPVDVKDLIGALVKSVKDILPDVEVKPYQSILLARQEQRNMMYRLELTALSIVMAGSAAAIWGLTYQNVRNRRREIGVFSALGVPGWRVGTLFVGKILLYSVAGAALGCVVGYYLAVWFNVTGRPITVPRDVFTAVVLLTPLAAILFGLPPVVTGLMQEPTRVLGEGAE